MAQYYPRIVNPYMPQGTPDLTNAPSPYYAPGELGCTFNDQDKGGSYLRVQLDSGATSATSVGAVVAGQLAYWKSTATSTVTNDKNQCDLGPTAAPNRIAGIFQLAVSTSPNINGTDGQPKLYMCDLVIQKNGYPVQASGTIVAGGLASGDTTANTARAISQASIGAAYPPTAVIGTWASATVTNNTAPMNINIGFID